MLLTYLLDLIERTYGDLNSPNFSFQFEVLEKRPYDEVMRKVTAFFQVSEWTGPDYDVSFVFYLDPNLENDQREGKIWFPPDLRKLKISMLGPYALFLRLGSRVFENKPNEAKVLTSHSKDLTSAERGVIRLLREEGITFLDEEILLKPVPLKLFDEEIEDVRIYHALFSEDTIPF